MPILTFDQCQQFQRQGYLVLPARGDKALCEAIIAYAEQALEIESGPIEYEAEKHYPGAPASLESEGGRTARRLLQAFSRDPMLANWAQGEPLAQPLRQLLGEEVYLSQAHHNCIMTKQPRFSSLTGWHRDSRYWQFQRAELISAWLALRNETEENGCLWVLPSSHLLKIEPHQLDEVQFLRGDLAENQKLLTQAIPVALQQGDVLLFHSNLFHAAGRNQTAQTKLSLVFTYRAADNIPQLGSRSASLPDIVI